MRWIAVMVALATLLVAGRAAGDEAQLPEILFAEGRHVAAATLFEKRWQEGGPAKDGLNAVIAWRVAGRYARGRSLLARVKARDPLDGQLAEVAAALEQALGELTATLRLRGTFAKDALIKIDGGAPLALGDAFVVDLGDHELTVEQPRCKPWRWRGAALPGEHVEVEAVLECDQTGTMKVVLARDRGAVITVDGERHPIDGAELSLPLAPGEHQVSVAVGGRVVDDGRVTIASGKTLTRRVTLPWRSSSGFWFMAAASEHFSTVDRATWHATGVFGRASRRYRVQVQLGNDQHSDSWGYSYQGMGLEAAWHVLPPLWSWRTRWGTVMLECDPLSFAVHRTSLRGVPVLGSTLGRVANLFQLGSVALTFDHERWHAEAVAWPLGLSHFTDTLDETSTRYVIGGGFFLGYRL